MSKVQVKYRGNLAVLIGIVEETLEAANVESVLRCIRKRHGKEVERAARSMLIARNGESIQLQKGYKTKLKEGDLISFFPLCAGG